jgi:hypothetical protein
MQERDGSMKQIEQKEFDDMVREFGAKARVVQVGDRFKIRRCWFEVTKITVTGIEARGLGDTEIEKTGNVRRAINQLRKVGRRTKSN